MKFSWPVECFEQVSAHIVGFPNLVSPNAKASKTLFRPIKHTNPSVWMAYKGQRSFKRPDIGKTDHDAIISNPKYNLSHKKGKSLLYEWGLTGEGETVWRAIRLCLCATFS